MKDMMLFLFSLQGEQRWKGLSQSGWGQRGPEGGLQDTNRLRQLHRARGHGDGRAPKLPFTSPGPSAPPRQPAAPPATVPIFPHLLHLLAFLLHFLSGSPDQVKTRVLQRYSSFLWALTGCPGRCQHSGSPFSFHAMMQRSGLR